MFIKHSNWLFTFVAAVCCAVASEPVSAQSTIGIATSKSSLKKLSAQLKSRAQSAQRHAQNVARRSGLPVRKELPDGTVIEIQRISPAGRPIFYITNNVGAADTVSTDELWPGGSTGLNLDGSGMTVGEWDGGAVYSAHSDFTGRLVQVDGATTVSGHSTHVAGTLIGSGAGYPPATGMAYAADLDAYDWNSDTSEMAAAAANGLLISNHSYGIAAGWIYIGDPPPNTWWWIGGPADSDVEDPYFGFYDTESQLWDQIAFDAPYYLIVKAAGNDRTDTGPLPEQEYTVIDQDGNPLFTSTEPRDSDCAPAGYDCLPTQSVAKNILTVGAANDLAGGYASLAGPSQVGMMSFSGWGPTDDGRIKPDVVGNGEFVVSAWNTSPYYAAADGTSMAAPNVTGSLLLLQQHYENIHGAGNFMRSATLKALAIHTADEAGSADGPDYKFGWGLLNTESAARVITEDGGSHRIIEETLSDNSTNITQINVNEPEAFIKVTLVWTDPPGTPVALSLDPSDPMLVNDLDLRVTSSSSTHMPWVLNPALPADPADTGDNIRDNVEQVVIDNGGPGAYFVEVSHKGTLLNGQNQAYSLIISMTRPPVTGSSLLIDEDFTSGLPPGWSVDTTMGIPWTINTPVSGDSRLDNRTGGTGQFAIVDNGYAHQTVTSLQTSRLDLSSNSAAVLRFQSFHGYDTFETFNVDASTDGGTAWFNVWQTMGATFFPTLYTIDVSAIAGHSNAMLKFRFDSEGWISGDFWQIDDVELEVYGGAGSGGDPCGAAYNLPANQWRFISLPCDPGSSNSIADIFGDDLTPADYGIRWVLFERDEIGDQYLRLPDVTSVLHQGQAYFAYSMDAGLLDTTGTVTTLTNRPDCPSPDNNCFVIPLVKPATTESTLFNALGHPLPYPVDWADFRIVASGDLDSPMTPSGALAKNYMSKVVYKYTGSAYVPFDDVTPGYDEGALGAYDGFWVEALGDSLNTGDLSLLIPNLRSPGVITTDSAVATTLEATSANTNPGVKTRKIPPGLAKRDAHRKRHRDAKEKGEEWYVRLTISAPAEQLIDDGNILGQLYDSEFGPDQHDLVETPPNTPYLTIVFPQETWGEHAGDYTSDFHPVTGKKVLDQWEFEVRSDDPEREVKLEWTGPDEILGMSWLIDQDTGEVIEPDNHSSYSFIMKGKQRRFNWDYKKHQGKGKK